MIAELGHYALILALALALVQSVSPVIGARQGDVALMRLGESTALAQFAFVALAYGALTACYVTSDFSVQNVFENSHSQMPLIYKFTSVWGNHEGSMLLWVLILAIFGALVAAFGINLPISLKANVLAVQSWVASAFYLFILLTSNPFKRMAEVPVEGRDLNPILQDFGLAVHPPMLYLGYVGFSIAFSFAVAALLEGRIDAAWARWVRPWTLLAWMSLTLGIAMGSYWAYYELGWGGWWFWDPVENASLMPWLAGTALLHSAVVMEKRNALKVWTILLAILTFSLSLIGTFLVRSGVLTSVHTFSTDPARGLFILLILTVFIGGSLALFAWRAPALKQGGLFAPISRESALVLNNLLLSTACATVFVGTLYPLALEALHRRQDFGRRAVLQPHLRSAIRAPARGGALRPAAGVEAGRSLWGVAALAWGRCRRLYRRCRNLCGCGNEGRCWLRSASVLALFVMAGSITDIAERVDLRSMSLATISRRAAGLPRSAWGTALAHFALGITLAGIVCETTWNSEQIVALKPSQMVSVSGYDLTFDGITNRAGSNYKELVARFSVRKGGSLIATMEPSKRLFPSRDGMTTTEAALLTRGFSQLYLSLGDSNPDGTVTVRLYHKPLVLLIWVGAIVMVFGGALSLSDRRLRVGAPKPAARILPQPAE